MSCTVAANDSKLPTQKKVESTHYTLKLIWKDVTTNPAFLLRHKKAKSQRASILIFSEHEAPAKTAKHQGPKSQVNQEIRLWLKLLFAAVAGWLAREAASFILKPWWVKCFEGGLSNEDNAMQPGKLLHKRMRGKQSCCLGVRRRGQRMLKMH